MNAKPKLRRFKDKDGKVYEICCEKSHTHPFEFDGNGFVELEELEDGWFNLIQFGTRVKVREITDS